jgi:hypothetical protein
MRIGFAHLSRLGQGKPLFALEEIDGGPQTLCLEEMLLHVIKPVAPTVDPGLKQFGSQRISVQPPRPRKPSFGRRKVTFAQRPRGQGVRDGAESAQETQPEKGAEKYAHPDERSSPHATRNATWRGILGG